MVKLPRPSPQYSNQLHCCLGLKFYVGASLLFAIVTGSWFGFDHWAWFGLRRSSSRLRCAVACYCSVASYRLGFRPNDRLRFWRVRCFLRRFDFAHAAGFGFFKFLANALLGLFCTGWIQAHRIHNDFWGSRTGRVGACQASWPSRAAG